MRGFDKHSLGSQLLFALSLDEIAVGATPPSYDKAKPHHTCTLHGGAWNNLLSGLPYIDLSPNPDWIDCGAVATADLDFISGDFSFVIWVNPDAVGAAEHLFCRGVLNTDGWLARSGLTNNVSFYTNQAGDNQTTSSIAEVYAVGAWNLIGLSRSGASARWFHQGIDVTDIAATHIDPLTANRELHIGVRDDEAAQSIDGQVAGGPCSPRIWGRALAAWEHRQIFNMERHWFGV